MRNRSLRLAATVAVFLGFVIAPAQAVEPKSDQWPSDARKIAQWHRLLFWGLADLDPTPAKLRQKAPAANSVGLRNVFWDGTLPRDMSGAGYSTYVGYTTGTGGDSPQDGPDFGTLRSPGWNSVAGTSPPPDWIATEETTEYQQWAAGRRDPPAMLAHRGGGAPGEEVGPYPENSVAAFTRAVRDGAAVLETDVQWTKPTSGAEVGVAVLMHDAAINRTATCKPTATGCVDPVWPSPTPEQQIMVSDLTKTQLDAYRLSNGESIPTLQRLLDLADRHRVGVLPEIKEASVADLQPELRQYTDMMLAADKVPEVIIGTFDPALLQYFKEQATLVKQLAPCAALPDELDFGRKVLLRKACVSNADSRVRVRVRAKPGVAERIVRDSGRVLVKVHDAGKVRVRFWTPDRRGFTVFDHRRTYRVR